jgi:hypothetical protein
MVAYEKDYYLMIQADGGILRDKEIVAMLMWTAFAFNCCHVVALVLRHIIYFKWLFSKNLNTEFDTLISTGYWKTILIEVTV